VCVSERERERGSGFGFRVPHGGVRRFRFFFVLT